MLNVGSPDDINLHTPELVNGAYARGSLVDAIHAFLNNTIYGPDAAAQAVRYALDDPYDSKEESLDDPEPEAVLELHNALCDLKFDIENFGEQCVIRAGETDNDALRKVGQTLAEEAERCWNVQTGNLIERYLDDTRRGPHDKASSLEEAVSQSVAELNDALDEDIPFLMGKLDDARSHLR